MDENQETLSCQRNLSQSLEPQLWDTSLDRSFIPNEQHDYAYTLGSQIIRKSIFIDHDDLPIRFVYLSSSSNRRYQSILTVVLTSNEIDDYLLQIHLSISIEGIYFAKQFQAKRSLTYEYEWSRRNAYDQNVHGLAEATGRICRSKSRFPSQNASSFSRLVSIGYEYMNCSQIVWYRKSVKMAGQDIPTANVGGWTFNVHHKLNIQAGKAMIFTQSASLIFNRRLVCFSIGILHKGDGSNMILTDSPLQFSPLVGIRDQSRSADCRKCHENQGASTKLLHPMALTVSNDGTIYIGDLNMIWIYQPTTGLAKPVLELTEQYTYKYYLTTDPVDGRLYIADNARRQIIRLAKIDSIESLRENYEIVVGDGQFCTLDVVNNITCGDGLLAKDVSLSYPKGLTIDRYGTMYFIDGQRIRKLSIDTSRVTHLAGAFEYQLDYQRQLSCNRTYPLDQVGICHSIEGWSKLNLCRLLVQILQSDNTAHSSAGRWSVCSRRDVRVSRKTELESDRTHSRPTSELSEQGRLDSIEESRRFFIQ